MPFKSQAQRAYMHIHHPEIADRWEKETPKGELPEHVGDSTAGDLAYDAVKKKHAAKQKAPV